MCNEENNTLKNKWNEWWVVSFSQFNDLGILESCKVGHFGQEKILNIVVMWTKTSWHFSSAHKYSKF